MKKQLKNLLPKVVYERVALNHKLLNIKPRLQGLVRLKFFPKFILSLFILLFLLGYQPFFNFKPLAKSLVLAQDLQEHKIIAAELPPLQLPHPGYLSTPYSFYHQGIDIATGFSMPIHPISDGIVEEVDFGIFGYGNHVIISHNPSLKSLYGHMGRIYVKSGQTVTMKDTLGTVGLSGFTTGPHTHLEITKDGHTIDPQTILPPLQQYPSEEYLKPFKKAEKLTKTLKPNF